MKFVFIVFPSRGLPKYIKTADDMLLPFMKLFRKKQIRGLVLAFRRHFLHDFRSKTFLTLYYINWPNFIAWLPYTSWDIGQYLYSSYLFPSLWLNFEIKLSFLSSRWPKIDQKFRTKSQISRDPKIVSNMKWIAFFIIFKEFCQKLPQTRECPFKIKPLRISVFLF